jgi:membrane protease YdiL (CAAX protease family)
MTSKQFLTLAATVLGGLVYFNVLMGVSMQVAFFNVDWSPTVPWFPIPLLALIWLVTWWIKGRWNVRLTAPPNVSWARIYAFSFLAMLAAKTIKGLEGAYHGTTLAAPALPQGVSTGFGLVFLLMIPIIAGVLAEIAYRGIMQTRFEAIAPLWPTLVVLAIINTLGHMGFTDVSTQWIYLMAMNIGFGYTAYLAQSIIPVIVVHATMNVIFPGSQYLWGPFALGELSGLSLAAIALLGTALTAAAVWLARSNPAAGSLKAA